MNETLNKNFNIPFFVTPLTACGEKEMTNFEWLDSESEKSNRGHP